MIKSANAIQATALRCSGIRPPRMSGAFMVVNNGVVALLKEERNDHGARSPTRPVRRETLRRHSSPSLAALSRADVRYFNCAFE